MNAGLEGVVAAETRLSMVDGEAARLVIAGETVETLAARARFAEIASRLWRGLTPAAQEPADIEAALGEARIHVAAELLPQMRALAPLSPIEALRAGIALLPDDAPMPPHLLASAAIPVIIAAHWRTSRGRKPVLPRPGATHVADFLRMLDGRDAEPEIVRALETYLVTVSDHGMNASTFAARVVASTAAGVISSVVAAICALKGPLHGGAPGPVLDMLDEIAASGGADAIRPWLEARMAGGERLMGFGHRIYRRRDPRADVLKTVVRGLGTGHRRLAFAAEVEATALAILGERYPDRRLDTNVEFYTAILLDAVGLDRALFTPAFAMGRVLGWTAHALEQAATGRLIRPASHYVGSLPDGMEAPLVPA
ncbi:citrate synthase [Oceanibacterium hippocampi]|uniref:Citrate synthase n=1 Tax=Oceanibacterium hippocampi TaxID=745714 RepID=A0A1Y5T3M3_9PROT|nr:citrate synthase [Oceanibacterium hippocampi]SLN55162.1 Citrate synthase 1 [Oceanibacterium hippocampi]